MGTVRFLLSGGALPVSIARTVEVFDSCLAVSSSSGLAAPPASTSFSWSLPEPASAVCSVVLPSGNCLSLSAWEDCSLSRSRTRSELLDELSCPLSSFSTASLASLELEDFDPT